ncbi:MAG: radical SAM protein [Nanoarchaeota archaeon]|nr:radical SAM protein [Nanoarchaeota archaeon]
MMLNELIIKPLYECACSCQHCSERQKLYSKSKKESVRVLDLNTIYRIFREAGSMGTEVLQLSGGEILLHEHFEEIVMEAKKYDWFVFCNSTGWNLTKKRVKDIYQAGLDAFNISLDSSVPEQHDRSRGLSGLFQSALDTMDIFNELKRTENRKNPFYTNVQVILMRQNFRQFPDMFCTALEHGADSVYIMHIYDDLHRRFLLSRNDITEFEEKVIPKIVEVLKSRLMDSKTIKYATDQLNSLFEQNNNSKENYVMGRYWNAKRDVHAACIQPLKRLMILPNGDVMPCCTLENSHSVIIGNVFKESLKKIWNGKKMIAFRNARTEYCLQCPSVKNRTIGFVPELQRQFQNEY